MPAAPVRFHFGREFSAQEPFVAALLQLALDLLDRVQAGTDHDEQAHPAEREEVPSPISPRAIIGSIATMPRYAAPGAVSLVST